MERAEAGPIPNEQLDNLLRARAHILAILTRSAQHPASTDMMQWYEALGECLQNELELRQSSSAGHFIDLPGS